MKLSLFNDPVGPVLSVSNLLHFLTATSARPFNFGKYEEDMCCFTPHLVKKSFVLVAMNSGPPSLESSSGTPNVKNRDLNDAIKPSAPAYDVPCGALNISTHPDKRSPAMR